MFQDSPVHFEKGYNMNKETVIVLDFGGQYNQLIARRVRECNVYCEILPYTVELEKIKALKKYCDENNYNIDIEVDGGIGPDNIGLLTSNGANIIVAGSAVFKAENYGEVISKMLSEAEKNPYNS